MCLLGDGGGFVIADVRIERGHEHQRTFEQLADALVIGLDATRTVRIEACHAVGEKPDALQHVVNDERPVHIELEITRRAADVDRDVVAEYLGAQHRQRLALRRIYLPRHDRASGLVLRNRDLTEA